MALVTEDGTGKSDAESFISVEDADDYFEARGITNWGEKLSTTEKEQALRRGTDYLEATYGDRWKGERVTADQALSWPRYGVCQNGFDVASDVVPVAVQRACAEMAIRAAAGELSPDLGAQVKSEQVGPIAVTYADGARQQVRYQAVDNLLAGLLSGGGQSFVKVVRA